MRPPREHVAPPVPSKVLVGRVLRRLPVRPARSVTARRTVLTLPIHVPASLKFSEPFLFMSLNLFIPGDAAPALLPQPSHAASLPRVGTGAGRTASSCIAWV